MRGADLFSLAQIPKFGIVLVFVLVLGALGFRKETDVMQLICSVSLIAKRSGFSRTRTTTSIQESRGFFGCDMNTSAACALSRLCAAWGEEKKQGGCVCG